MDHALGFALAIEDELGRPPHALCDLGTGGGLPGLVLGAVWYATRIVLLDVSERRTEFLRRELSNPTWSRDEADRAALSGRIEVLRGRAEEIARDPAFRESFEVVTARSFGAPAVTAECGAPLLAVGGMLVVSEPPAGTEPDRWPSAGVAEVGLDACRAVMVEGYHFCLLSKHAPTPTRYPRRTGVPAKRPLY